MGCIKVKRVCKKYFGVTEDGKILLELEGGRGGIETPASKNIQTHHDNLSFSLWYECLLKALQKGYFCYLMAVADYCSN
jgi:hypothetical protein